MLTNRFIGITHRSLTHLSLHTTGFLCASVYIVLAWQSHSVVDLTLFISSLSLAALATFMYWAMSYHNNTVPPLIPIFLWAIVFRVIALYGMPILEDDFYRYLWDGYMLVEHGSPYGIAPSVFFENETLSEPLNRLLDGINHPDIATIYGPACQWLFALAYLIAPAEIWPLQLLFSLFDLAIIGLLSRVAHPRNLLLYAWCPLLIKEVAFTAHTDIVAIFFVVAACSCMQKQHWKTMGVLLALGIASKIFALLIAPFLLLRHWKSWLPFIAVLIAIYLPFAEDILQAQHGLAAMASGWVFNSPLHYILSGINQWIVKFALAAILLPYLAFLLFRWLRSQSTDWPPAEWVYAAFLLVIPVVNPWYLLWLLPFAVLRPQVCIWTASVVVLFAYVIGLHLSNSSLAGYEQPLWALALQYLAILIAGLYDIHRTHRIKRGSS